MDYKLLIRYADWTFDTVMCADKDFPQLKLLVYAAPEGSVLHMDPESEHNWNQDYLPQPWRDQ